MARLLGEARVAILPDGTRFKPETEATVKKAMAGMQAKVNITGNDDELLAKLTAAEVAIHKVIDKQYDAKFGVEESKWNLQVAKLKTQLEALTNKSVNIKTSMDLARFNEGVARVIAESDGMTTVVQKNADKMAAAQAKVGAAAQAAADKEVAAYTKAAAESAAAQQVALDRIRKARESDSLSQQRVIADTQKMYAKMFDDLDKEGANYSKISDASASAQEASMKRIQKAREADILSQQKGIAGTQSMYSKMFDDLNKRDKVKVNVDGSLAETEALSLRERLKATLKDIKAKVRVDDGSLAATSRAILSHFGGGSRFSKGMESAGSGGGGAFGGGFVKGLARSALMQNPGITALVLAGLAALPAAVGAVGVLGGVALGAGMVFGAEKLVKSQVKNLTASIKQTQTAMGGTPVSPAAIAGQQLSIQTTQNTIARLSATKQLTVAQQQQLAIAKQRLVIQQQTLAASQGKGQGTAAQQQQLAQQQAQLAQYQKYQGMFSSLDRAMSRLKLSFLQFAVVAAKPLIQPFSKALDYLSAQLRGPLGKLFANLFKAVAPYVKPVLDSLLLIVKGILPGMTDMLNKARGPLISLFINFGKIVGLHIGQWFRDAIPFIKDSGKYLLVLVDVAGKVISWLIKFGGAIAKAFAGSEFMNFGKLIGEIGKDILAMLIPAFEGWAGVMAPVVKYLLELMVPILDFLAKNPAWTKAIFGIVAAFMILSKALRIVDISLAITDALEIGGVWGFVAIAVVAAAILIIKYWGPISRFFIKMWKEIYKWFIQPLKAGFIELGIVILRVVQSFTDGVLNSIGLIIHGAADAFGWIPGLGSKLRGADSAFSAFHRSVDSHFNGMIKTMQKWQDHLFGVTHVAKVTTAQIAGDFNKQKKAAGSAAADVDILTGAIRSHGINSDQFHKARQTLVKDMTAAGVKSSIASKDIGDYTGAIIAHGLKSDQARGARLRMINDILAANKNSVNGKEDLDKYVGSVIQQGTKADATRAARKRLIADLEKSGVDAKDARNMVDGLESSIKNLKSKTIVLNMQGNGQYSISQAAARNTQHVKSPSGNFSTFIGHAAKGMMVNTGTTPTADDQLVRVSKGELIVPAHLVSAGAVDNVRGKIPGFAKGGYIQDNKSVQNGTFPTKVYNQFSWEMTNTMADKMVASMNKARQVALAAAAAVSGASTGPLGSGTSAGEMANGQQLYNYLLANVFGGSKIAAAGATASIWGESTWNPFAQGTGGRGLIGWTPPGTISNAAFQGGMATQLPAIIKFIANSGDWGVIKRMESASSVLEAANLWGKGVERYGINDVHSQGIALATQIMSGSGGGASTILAHTPKHAQGGLIPGFAAGGKISPMQAKANAIAAAHKKAEAKQAEAADARRVAKLELKPLATLKGLATHYKAKMAKDTRTGDYRDYYGSTLALEDVNKAISGWKSPLQREHDADAMGYRKYSTLAAKARAAGNEKAFFRDAVQAAKYAAAIGRIDKKLNAQAPATGSTFVPLNMPLNRDYMTGFGQFGGSFRLGGTLPEGVMGRGVKSGMSYMMGAGERVVPPNSTAANPGQDMAQTNQLLLSLLAELKTANKIGQVTAQNTQAAAKGLGNAGRAVR